MKLEELKANERNPRKPFTKDQLDAFAKSLAEFGDLSGIVFNKNTGQLVGGHKRVEQFKKDAAAEVVIERVLDKPDKAGTLSWGWVESGGTRFSYRVVSWPRKKEAAANIAANQHGAEFDMGLLEEVLRDLGSDFDLALLGFDQIEIASLTGTPNTEATNSISLRDRFLVPPFSVLDARQGYWQERKGAWLALGIRSELGRVSNALGFSETILNHNSNKTKIKRDGGK